MTGYRQFVATALVGTGLAVCTPAGAQDWGRLPTPRDGACFYKTANYRDDYFCLRAGESLNRLPRGVADDISAIRVFGRVEVMAYGNPNFKGREQRYTSNVRDLRRDRFNNQISSISVRSLRERRDDRGGPSSRDPDVIVRRAYEDLLDREPDRAGLRLYRSRIIDDGWTEQDVREALRKSSEYRELHTMTRPKAEGIVREAYLNVLGREPDPGSRVYVDNVLRKKWSQADVERALRRSPEYRNR